jgi:phosphoglycerate dehydrogenase-like enzyme
MTKMVFLSLDEFFLTPLPTLRRWAERVRSDVPGLDVVVVEPDGDAAAELAGADAAFGSLTPELLEAAGRLRWLQAPAASPPPGYYFPALVAHPVVVTNMRGVYRANLANHVMAFVLAFARGLPWFSARQSDAEWERSAGRAGIVDLGATTALVVGVGEVGVEVARRCRAFGMGVIGVDARPGNLPAGAAAVVDGVHSPDQLDQVLPQADFVILTLPHTPDTQGMIDADRLRLMKPSAVLINVGRGVTVRLDDLVAALDAGRLAGAGLDVFETEPLPPTHPLWRRRNVVITPHVAGFGQDTDAEREELIADNSRRFVDGLPLRNVVDKAKWF